MSQETGEMLSDLALLSIENEHLSMQGCLILQRWLTF